MPVILPGRKSWPRLRPQPIARQGGWSMPRPKGPAETTAYLSLQDLSTAESSAYTKLMDASSNRRKQKGEGIMRFIIAAALGIQQSTEALLVNKLNELAVRLRENRTEIDNLRRQLSILRKPVQLIDFSTSLRFPVYPRMNGGSSKRGFAGCICCLFRSTLCDCTETSETAAWWQG
jgi:hypothetical protein